MKFFALLSIGAALAVAQDQDTTKKADPRPTNPATQTRAERLATPATQPRRNVHKPPPAFKSTQLTPQQKAAAALPGLPEGAEEVSPNLYRYTDPQGKKWMYRNTPFGYSKWEEKSGDQNRAAETSSSAGTTMTDLGDTVQFQRLTPFGPQKWTRKKSELSDEEKATLATQQHAKEAVSGQPSEKQPEKQ